jgi:superfamily II DNA or RNA helicase
MKLADRCRHEFDGSDQHRGRSYFDSRAVEIGYTDAQSAQACSAGSNGSRYDVKIDWCGADSGLLVVRCSCPRFDDGHACKHLWATILELDRLGFGAKVPGRSLLDLDEVGWEIQAGVPLEYSSHGPKRDQVTIVTPGPPGESGIGNSTSEKGQRSAQYSKPQDFRHRAPWQQTLEYVRRNQARAAENDIRPTNFLARRERQAWYVLDVGRSVANDGLVIAVEQRERKKDGQFGKPKSLQLDAARAKTFTDPADRELLELFAANSHWAVYDSGNRSRYSYYSFAANYSAIKIPSTNRDFVLPRLAASGRFLWKLEQSQPFEDGQPVGWNPDNPWYFTLTVAANDKKQRWTVGGRFQREGNSRPIDEVVLVEKGLLLFASGELCPLESTDIVPWLQAIHRQSAIEVPYRDRTLFLKQLWSTPALPQVELPENLAIEKVQAAPLPKLQIHAPNDRRAPKNHLAANVFFLYGDQREHEIAADNRLNAFYSDGGEPAARVDAASVDDSKTGGERSKGRSKAAVRAIERVILRDLDREKQYLHGLSEFPIQRATDFGASPGELQFHQKHLASMVDKLAAQGWRVEAEGKLFRSAGTFQIEVTSEIDWFELDAAFDFDGIEVKLPDLLAAVRKGAKYVELGDGSRGILPERWLARYADLANLGASEDGKVRFKPSQALMIDALLAEQESGQDQIRLDQKFTKFRQRLKSFAGVQPKIAPKTFRGKLRQYQCEGLGWFHFLRTLGLGGCLADDMGLGKTVQVLALLESRRTRRLKRGETRVPSLVVVPKSLIFNWIDEAGRFTPKLRVADYTGIDRKVRVGPFEDHHLIVTTYGTLRRDITRLKDQPFDYVILDEAQAIKNAGSQAAKASLLLRAEHRLALTGTPIENHLGELWSLFEFLNPGMLGMSSSFASLCRGASRDSHQSLAELAQAVTPFILRRTKDQVLKELPKKTEQTLYCEFSPKERQAYNQLRDYYRAKLSKTIEEKGLNQSKIHVLEALLRLRQASCHFGLVDKKKSKLPSAKLETLLEQVREIVGEGHKGLIFSQFTSLLAIVRKRLDAEGIRYEYLDGRTRKRKERVDAFQNDPDCPLFLISLKAGGHGLNLTAADYVYILDPWWNPAVEAQAIDRTHRIGQTRRVFAYRIIAKDTVEEKVLKLHESKRELADAIITANDSLIRKLTAEDLKLMLS